MAYYGEWLQRDDYEAAAIQWVHTGVPLNPGAFTSGPDHFDPVRTFYDSGEMANTLTAANDGPFTGGGYNDNLTPGVDDGLATVYIDRFASGGSGADSTRYLATARAMISATSSRTTAPLPAPTLPPGAIGYDIEDGPPVPLGLTLDYSFAHMDADYTSDPAGTPISGAGSTQLIVGGGEFDSVDDTLTVAPTGVDGTAVGSFAGSGLGIVDEGAIDLTAYMGGTRGHVALYVRLVLAAMPEPANPLAVDRAMSFGAIPTFTYTYLMRPQRHRFLYPDAADADTTRVTPPRRLDPRDDDLGPSGGLRLSGSRSRQRSLRLSGSYL